MTSFDLCDGGPLECCQSCQRNLANCSDEIAAMRHSKVRIPDGPHCGSYVQQPRKTEPQP